MKMPLLPLVLCFSLCLTINLNVQLLQLDEHALARHLIVLEDYLMRLRSVNPGGTTQLMLDVIASHRANKARRDPLVHLQRLANSHATQMFYIRKRFLREPIDEHSKMAVSIVELVLFQAQEDSALQTLLTGKEKARWRRLMVDYRKHHEWTSEKRAVLKTLSSQIASFEEVRTLIQHFEKYPGNVDRKFVDQAVARMQKLTDDSALLRAIERYNAATTTVETLPIQREIHRLWEERVIQ